MATYIPTDATTINQDMNKEKNNTKPRILKYEEQIYEYVTPSENQPAETTEKETLKYKTFSTFSAPSKSEETEEYLQENRTPQEVLAPEPVLQKKKEKSKEKKDQVHACLKARKKRLVQYDSTEPEDDDVMRHIIRLREKFGWQTILPQYNLKYKSSKTAVQKIVLKKRLEDDGEFVYCLPRKNPKVLYNPYNLQVVTKIDGEEDIEYIPTLEWLLERRCCYLLQQLKIFYNFRIFKAFVTWKLNVRRIKTEKSRSFLYHHLFWADELYQGCLLYIKGLCEDALNLKNGNEYEDNPSAICLVKLDRSRTYSLDEFCEGQLQQAAQALKQLEDIRTKAISRMKSTFLKVAEKKEVKEFFESHLYEDDTTHFKLPQYRHLLETMLRFLMLVDYIFQELIRQLMNSAVTLLLELFNNSARMPFSAEKKNEKLIK
ncbi:dynein axonemal heavy chain 14 isoform X2 [Rhinolophus sinicus]|uniref:dynein axonemal heavy chain 14 isoform X2 n=1 Tax=Rhinolophus sinicus TaxID=89399 RepID=UPI003D7BCDEC